MYDLLTGYTVGDDDDDLTRSEHQQLQARAAAEAQLSVQSGGSRAAARWTDETTPVDAIPSRVAPPPTQKRPSKKQASSSRRAEASQKVSTKGSRSAQMVIDSNSDDGMDVARTASGLKRTRSSAFSKAPGRTKPPSRVSFDVTPEASDGSAPSKALDPDVRRAVLLDIQAIVARHIARGPQAPRVDDDVIMSEGRDESQSEGDVAMQGGEQIPLMSEKMRGKQKDTSASQGDVEMRNFNDQDMDDAMLPLRESHLVGDFPTSYGFLNVGDQSFDEDQGVSYGDGEIGVTDMSEGETGPSPWTTDGSASRPHSPHDIDDGTPPNENAPRTPQAGQRRTRKYFSSMTFLKFFFTKLILDLRWQWGEKPKTHATSTDCGRR